MENEEEVIGIGFGVGFGKKLWRWRDHFVNVKVSFAEDRISDIGDGELQDEGLKD